jgi:hypothetical protein
MAVGMVVVGSVVLVAKTWHRSYPYDSLGCVFDFCVCYCNNFKGLVMGADVNYWYDMLADKTTKDLEALQKAVEVLLVERDKVKAYKEAA